MSAQLFTLSCSREAKISPLYYQSGNSEKAGATICVGKPCGATLCTDKLCWGDEVAEKKPTAIAKYINTLASDFAWYFERLDYIESWNWESVSSPPLFFSCKQAWIEDWTLTKRGLSWYAKINYIRSAGVEASQNMVKNELSQIIGVPATWFEFVIKEEGGIGGTTIGELWVHDPAAFPEETEQKGFVDLLFFAGIAESLEEELFCRIHTTCLHSYKRFCYRYLEQNLIGEYSGNNHARENTCYANVDPEWGHTKVSINEDRTGGIFHMQCDEGCRFCKKEGTFVGDECICFVDESHPEPTGYPYYCISVKYASAFSLAPSIFLFLFNLWRFI